MAAASADRRKGSRERANAAKPAKAKAKAPARGEFWFVYIVRCSDASLYTGIARDVLRRLGEHDAGRGARYTRGRGPVTLCAKRRCATKSDALRLELAVKRLARRDKERLTERGRLARFARAFFSASHADHRASKPA